MSTSQIKHVSRTRSVRRVWLAVGIMGLLTLILAGWLTQRTWPERRKAEAVRAALADRDLETAGSELQAWLHARPNSAEAHYLNCRYLLAQERTPEALDAWNEAKRLGYPEIALEPLRGVLLARGGRHNEAEPLLRRSQPSADGQLPEVLEALARIAMETFRFGAALETIERWAAADPKNPKPFLWKAEIDQRREAEPVERVASYREALQRDPESAEALLGLADAHQDAQQFDQATRAYDAYLERFPDDPAAHLGAGKNALSAGNETQAAHHFDQAIALEPEMVEALAERASVALRTNETERALELLDRAKQLEPENPTVRYRRSLALVQLGRHEEAKAERLATEEARKAQAELVRIRDGLIHSPNDVELQYEAARWLIDHGYDEEGLRWARKALDEHPGHPELCRFLAEYYEQRQDFGLANYYRSQLRGNRGSNSSNP